MAEFLPKLVPIWHDIAFQDFIQQKCNASFQSFKPPDHGGIGIDVNCDDSTYLCKISKYESSQINLGANCCALPFLPMDKVINLPDSVLEPLRNEKLEYDKFCFKLHEMRKLTLRKRSRTHLKGLQRKIKSIYNARRTPEELNITVPENLMYLVKHLPKRVVIPPVNFSYAGGNLAVSKSRNIHHLVHPNGEELNKLCITPLEDETGSHFKPLLSEQITISLKDGPILQIENALNEFCCVRQKTHFHLLNFTNAGISSKKVNKSLLHHIAASPYNPLEILSIYDEGELKLRNMETSKTLWSMLNDSYEDNYLKYSTWRCGFGSHPFAALCLNEKKLYHFDLRIKDSPKREIFNVQNASCDLNEELVSLKQWNRNSFQHLLTSDHHLIICDERYPRISVMQWNHTMNDYPLYCEYANFQNDLNSVVVIGTQGSQETTAFFINSPETSVHPVSLNHPLALSSPTDCIDSLKLHCYHVYDKFASRLSHPLTGISVVSCNNENAFTAFQITSAGDIFYQDVKETTSDVVERTYRVTTGCTLTPPEKILPSVKDFISDNDMDDTFQQVDKTFSRLRININKILNPPTKISSNCTLCRSNSTADGKDLVLSENCPFCGLDSIQSENFSKAFANLSALIGPPSDESAFLDCDLDYLSQFTDTISKKILNVWLDSDNTNLGLMPDSNAETDLERTFMSSYQHLTSDTTPSNLVFQSKDLMPSTNTGVSVEINDFTMNTEDFSEDFIPPSQEIRTLAGETLFRSTSTKAKQSVLNLSTAGF